MTITRDLTRVMVRLKALYRSWAIPCAGQQVYAPSSQSPLPIVRYLPCYQRDVDSWPLFAKLSLFSSTYALVSLKPKTWCVGVHALEHSLVIQAQRGKSPGSPGGRRIRGWEEHCEDWA